MTNASSKPVIAYLAPGIPLLSATFVYEELLGVERRGISVIPITVRRPTEPADAQADLAARTLCVYDAPFLVIALSGLAGLPAFGTGALKALRWLIADMAEVGVTRLSSWKLAFQMLAAVRLARLVRQYSCSHLHVHFAHVPAQIAMYASALAGIPFTIVAHANDIFERPLLLLRKAERATRMLTISEHNRQYLERLGIPKDRLAVVRCGVSFSETLKSPSTAEQGDFHIGTLGRMVEKKGFDVLIRAIAYLKTAGHKVKLRIAGDGPLKSELALLVEDLDIVDITRFDGQLHNHRVASWMRQLDIFVLACKKDRNGDMDGIPVVLMEAMSQSVPVISTTLSGIPELVIHESTWLLAEPDDHYGLARQIARMIESTDLRAALTERAREHVMNEFGQANNLDRLIGHFGLQSRLDSI